MDKQIDVVIYGATGFTGQLVAEYLQRAYHGSELRWAMAGRNLDKLTSVKRELAIDDAVPLIVADSTDTDSLAAMVAQAKVVIAAAGPYQLYGEPLVAACVAAGTDYVDLCGEPSWMRQMIDTYRSHAQESGARIVHSCGFDSVPSDLGVFQLQQLAKNEFGKPFTRVKGRVEAMQGGPSGGTVASFMVSAGAAKKDPAIGALMVNPFALTPGFEGPKQPSGMKPVFDEELNSWASSFVMAVINTKNVHRSNAMMGHPYGTDFQYDEMIATGPGDKGEQVAIALSKGDGLVGKGTPPAPGEGPSKQEQQDGFFTLAFHGNSDSGQATVRVSGDKDPGYGCTSMMIAESALCLLEQGGKLGGGFFTPASAMGAALLNRLSAKKVLTFKQQLG
ncbi:saccharopine dehydrogenase family protein [Ferrimonas lipolytica]|uniref:NAD(P)H-binding protein n=1 Tax=Ferrimonas lipolytica TaxID=2724191 RepID=A0A6H1UCM2_9GAMM|nr:saccharopine dehydrogenase NADP-binding domain-containing protein [Ferrimonas lipolytica]QIZ76103.1 NAD(P)H-binding protein [Ferrimonas lipolytica]